jgi:hypothetical protein
MKARGWASKETLWNATEELEHYGFIKKTRQGGRHACSLYAVTWWSIDECGGKLEIPSTRAASNEWKVVKNKFRSKRKIKNAAPKIHLVCPEFRTSSEFKPRKLSELFDNCPENRVSLRLKVVR